MTADTWRHETLARHEQAETSACESYANVSHNLPPTIPNPHLLLNNPVYFFFVFNPLIDCSLSWDQIKGPALKTAKVYLPLHK